MATLELPYEKVHFSRRALLDEARGGKRDQP